MADPTRPDLTRVKKFWPGPITTWWVLWTKQFKTQTQRGCFLPKTISTKIEDNVKTTLLTDHLLYSKCLLALDRRLDSKSSSFRRKTLKILRNRSQYPKYKQSLVFAGPVSQIHWWGESCSPSSAFPPKPRIHPLQDGMENDRWRWETVEMDENRFLSIC